MSETPPAGWYPDPQDDGRQRYWDGSTWTEHTAAADAGSGTIAAGGTSTRSSDEPNTWTWQSIVVTILCCGGIFSLPGILNAGRAEGALRAGDTAAAREHAKKARTWTLVGLAVGLLVTIGVVVSIVASGAGILSALNGDCADAEPGSMQYEFCVGLCAEDVTGTPFEASCEGF